MDFVRDPAKAAGIHFSTATTFETGKFPGRQATLLAIKEALESAGVEFTNGKKPGVRLARAR